MKRLALLLCAISTLGGRFSLAAPAGMIEERLQELLKKFPEADLDHDGRPFAAKGATGFGVRTLVQLLNAY